MSLKARWLRSMLGVVFVGTLITTLASSSISFHGARRVAYEWLFAAYRGTIASSHQQIFQRLEEQARLLVRMPVLAKVLSTRHPLEIHAWLDPLRKPSNIDFWAVVGEDGTVIATSDPSCSMEEVRGRAPSTAEPTRLSLMCGRVPAFAVVTAVLGGQGIQGWLVLGSQLNETYADACFVSTGAEVVLIDREGPIASSFLDTAGKRITPDLGVIPREALWADTPHFGRYELSVPHYRGYHAGTSPLGVGISSLSSYLLSIPLLEEQSRVSIRAVLVVPTETMDIGAFYSTVSMVALSLLLLPLLGFVVWRLVSGFTRPISLLGKMTARVAEGNLECVVPVVGQDELGQFAQDFNNMVRRLRETQRRLTQSEKMAAVGQLAAGVGHEINNPLAYITANLGFATETLSELSDTARQPAHPLPPEVAQKLNDVSEALRDAQDGARRVGQIVRDLRTFARSDNTEERQVLEIRPIIESALKLTSNITRHRARITCDFQGTASVEVNEARLVQVFINLFVNAAQAIPEGHAEENELRVTTAMGADGFVVVEVSDTGKGMPPEVLERLFEPFFTTKPVGQGTGLGLSISRNIIEQLGGSLSARSTPGKGSIFRIALPAARRGPMASTPALPSHGAREKGGGRVLVVDDEPLVGVSAKRILSSLCDVVIVTSAREVLEMVEAGQRFDLVLCDLMMPQMTGMELYEELSRRAPELAARMLFLTGGSVTPDTLRFLPEMRWLEKPFDNEALRACISTWLEQARQPVRHAS